MPEAEGMLAADVSHDLHHYGRVDLHHAPGIRRTGLVHPLLSVPASSMQGSPHQFQPYPQKPPFLPQRPGSGSQVSPGKRKRKGQQGYASRCFRLPPSVFDVYSLASLGASGSLLCSCWLVLSREFSSQLAGVGSRTAPACARCSLSRHEYPQRVAFHDLASTAYKRLGISSGQQTLTLVLCFQGRATQANQG